jgi:hypothetical protein
MNSDFQISKWKYSIYGPGSVHPRLKEKPNDELGIWYGIDCIAARLFHG